MNSAKSAPERRAHWAEVMRSGQGREWDWRPELIQLTAGSLECLGTILGPEKVAALSPLIPEPRPAVSVMGAPWRDGMPCAEMHCIEAWPMHDTLRQLGLYGRYGVTDAHIPVESRRAHIKALVRGGWAWWFGSAFHQAFMSMPGLKSRRVIERVVRLADTRDVIDEDGGEIYPAMLALLGGASVGRIRNLMSEGRTFEGSDGYIDSASALRWLQGRPAFWNSIWQEDGQP